MTLTAILTKETSRICNNSKFNMVSKTNMISCSKRWGKHSEVLCQPPRRRACISRVQTHGNLLSNRHRFLTTIVNWFNNYSKIIKLGKSRIRSTSQKRHFSSLRTISWMARDCRTRCSRVLGRIRPDHSRSKAGARVFGSTSPHSRSRKRVPGGRAVTICPTCQRPWKARRTTKSTRCQTCHLLGTSRLSRELPEAFLTWWSRKKIRRRSTARSTSRTPTPISALWTK